MPRSRVRRQELMDVSFGDFNRRQANVIFYQDMQEQSGSVARVFSPAVALGRRNIVINGDFANFTANDPDNWVVTENPPANEISEVGSGQGHGGAGTGACNFWRTDFSAAISQAISAGIGIGNTYKITIEISVASAGLLRVTHFGGSTDFTTTGTKIITGTASNQTLGLAAVGASDITVDSVVTQITNIAASANFPRLELYVTANAASDPNGNEADATTPWVASNATLTSDGTIKDVGDFSIKSVFTGAIGNISFDNNTILTLGKRYKITDRIRHLGSGGIVNSYLAVSTGGITTLLISLDNTDTTFQSVEKEFVHDANSRRLTVREFSATNDGGAYIDNVSFAEANPLNGDITGLTLGVFINKYLGYMSSSDAVNDRLDNYSAELNSMMDFNNLSIDIFATSDTTAAGDDYLFLYGADANNQVSIHRSGSDLVYTHIGGGTTKTVTASGVVPAAGEEYHVGLSVEVSDDIPTGLLTGIFNGVSVGTIGSLSTYVGNLGSTLAMVFASDNTGANSWAGDGGHHTIIDRVLTLPEWRERAIRGGIR